MMYLDINWLKAILLNIEIIMFIAKIIKNLEKISGITSSSITPTLQPQSVKKL